MLLVSRTACGGAAVGSRATALGKVRALNQILSEHKGEKDVARCLSNVIIGRWDGAEAPCYGAHTNRNDCEPRQVKMWSYR